MSVITKPENIEKGVPAQFTLSRSELLSIVLSFTDDAYFEDTGNWYRVNFKYKSSPGNQYEIVEFDGQQSNPVANFLVSPTALDTFKLLSVDILDFDGGSIRIPRSYFTQQVFDSNIDVDLSVEPELEPWVLSATTRVNALGVSSISGNPDSPTNVPLSSQYRFTAGNISWVNVDLINFDDVTITVIIDGVEVSTSSWATAAPFVPHANYAGRTLSVSVRLDLVGYAPYVTEACLFIFEN
jgi:hypothetical protein